MTRWQSLVRTSLAMMVGGLAAAMIGNSPAGEADGRGDGGKVVVLFEGKSLDGWKLQGDAAKSKWMVGLAVPSPEKPREFIVEPATADGQLVNAKVGGVDIYSVEKFGDCTLDLEFMVPQGSNSGVYVMGEYEVQVLDGYGAKRLNPGSLGGIYGAAAPKVNAAKKPGQWQRLVIEFVAPRFENGKKVANARFVKVTLNGQVIHDNVEVRAATPGGVVQREVPAGPLKLQGDHGPVAYRNIRVILPSKP
jgi:hypothetical protein